MTDSLINAAKVLNPAALRNAGKTTDDRALSSNAVPYPDLELRLRLFIPSPLVSLDFGLSTIPVPLPGLPLPIPAPVPTLGGDGRGFSYDEGTHRFQATLTVNPDPTRPSPLVRGPEKAFGKTHTHWEDVFPYIQNPDDRPWWWYEWKDPSNHPAGAETQRQSTAENNRVEVSRIFPNTVAVSYHILASVPIAYLPQNWKFAPSIDANFKVMIRPNKQGVEYCLEGSHDGFPCYELYLNKKRIYEYDASSNAYGPINLFPPEDITMTPIWISVPTSASR